MELCIALNTPSYICKVITVIDCNNFWSPSGGGVRRYHLERMRHFREQQEFRIVFLMQDKKSFTEEISPGLIIEHVKAFKIPGNWEYRFLWQPWILRKYLRKYQPQLVEIGSPYWLPSAMRWATWFLPQKPELLGFWHADFPVTYVRRIVGQIHPLLGRVSESLAWAYARSAFAGYRVIQASSCEIMDRMMQRGLANVHWIPLGVDTELFHPQKRDESLVQQLKAGLPERLTLFFPHRLTEEKGVHFLLEAYPALCEKLGHEPALVIASVGPCQKMVEEAVQKWSHVQYIGFVNGIEEMARWYASTDMGLALSAWETFGLSILESMASGQVLIGANAGAAREHVQGAESGAVLPVMDASHLSEQIVAVYQNPHFAQMSKKSRAYAENYTWDACFTRQKKMYRSLIQNKETP